MFLSDICIKRPVFATVLSLVLVLFGIVGYSKLQVRGTPKIDIPIINVQANYSGASASYMEDNITRIIEKKLRSIHNVDYITSSSGSGHSNIQIFFHIDCDLDKALSDIRSVISEVSYGFPKDMKLPTVSKQNMDGFPSIWIAVTSTIHNDMELTEIIYSDIIPEFNRIGSVGSVDPYGARWYTLKIEPDIKKMYAYKISPEEIEAQVMSQNKDYPSGNLRTSSKEFVFQIKNELTNVSQFENLVIKDTKQGPIKLGNIARVSITPQERNSILRYNNKTSIALGIVKQSDANPISLSDDVTKEFPRIKKSLPNGVDLEIAYDSGVPIKKSVYDVFKTIMEALILVVLIIYLFLGSVRSSIIPFITIPISLIASFGFIKLFGFSINIFTLLALVLAIGLVVDDAIVVLENVYRHIEEGMDRKEASIKAVKEIGFAVIVMTLTLAAVFLPIGFLDGFLGKLFIEFAWTLAISVVISGFVALTLTPMMCSKLIKYESIDNSWALIKKFNYYFQKTEVLYVKYLNYFIDNKKRFYLALALIFCSIIVGFKVVKKTFVPVEDDGHLWLNFQAPEGSSLESSEIVLDSLGKILSEQDGVLGNFCISHGDSGFGIVIFKDWNDRSKHQEVLKSEINSKLWSVPYANVFAFNPPSMLSGPIKKPVEFNLQIAGNKMEKLDKASKSFIEKMKKYDVFEDIERDFYSSTPTINLDINKEKAQKYKVPVSSIATTMQYLYSGQRISNFQSKNGEYYDVVMEMPKEEKNKLSSISKIFVKSQSDKMINLNTLANVKEELTVKSYNHYNTLKAIGISANLNSKYTLQDAADKIEEIKNEILDDSSVKMEFLGDIKRMQNASAGILLTFFLGILFIYFILSAQFESFKDPLIILISVPFSIIGAIFLLIITGNTLNIYSNIGLITLIGLITKNSIMIVEFTNQLVESGKEIRNAVVEACRIRLRPILMTTFATILGTLPLSIAAGAGAEAKKSIGICIVGGMSLGTLFTLFVIPVIYLFLNKKKHKML